MKTSTLLLLPLVLVASSPTANPDDSNGITPVKRAGDDDTYLGRLYINSNCKKNKALIQQAWSEAGMLARAHNLWKPASDYQKAMDMYIGTDSTQDPWFWGTSYKKRLLGNIKRQYDLHTGNYPYRTYTYINCDDTNGGKVVGRCKQKGGFAYEKDSLGHWYGWSKHSITLCPRFFNEKGPLQPILNEGDRGNDTMKTKIDAYKFAQAWTLFHETYHMENTVSRPLVIDAEGAKSYGAKNVFEIARDKKSEVSTINAESYAAAAIAILVQKKWNLNDPPKPGACMDGKTCVSTLDADDGTEEGAKLGPDEDLGWSPPDFDTATTSDPPADEWERLEPADLNPKDYLGQDYEDNDFLNFDAAPDQCFNTTTSSAATLRQNIQAFCAGSVGEEVTNSTNVTANYGVSSSSAPAKRSWLEWAGFEKRSPPTGFMTVSVTWKDHWDCNNTPFKITKEDCEAALLTSVLDKCNENEDQKAGGSKNLGCGLYAVSVSDDPNIEDPPSPTTTTAAPAPSDTGKPSTCYIDTLGGSSPAVDAAALADVYNSWCDALEESWGSDFKLTSSKKNMRGLFPVTLSGSGDDGTAWAGMELVGSADCQLDAAGCKDALVGRDVNNCETDSGEKRGGEITVGCAKWYAWVEAGKADPPYYESGTDEEENAKALGPA